MYIYVRKHAGRDVDALANVVLGEATYNRHVQWDLAGGLTVYGLYTNQLYSGSSVIQIATCYAGIGNWKCLPGRTREPTRTRPTQGA